MSVVPYLFCFLCYLLCLLSPLRTPRPTELLAIDGNTWGYIRGALVRVSTTALERTHCQCCKTDVGNTKTATLTPPPRPWPHPQGLINTEDTLIRPAFTKPQGRHPSLDRTLRGCKNPAAPGGMLGKKLHSFHGAPSDITHHENMVPNYNLVLCPSVM